MPEPSNVRVSQSQLKLLVKIVQESGLYHKDVPSSNWRTINSLDAKGLITEFTEKGTSLPYWEATDLGKKLTENPLWNVYKP